MHPTPRLMVDKDDQLSHGRIARVGRLAIVERPAAPKFRRVICYLT